MHLWKRAGLAFGITMIFASGAWAQGACPPDIASLVPSNGVNASCHFNAAGEVGLGAAMAKIPFDNICTRSDKTPGKISTEVTQYKGASAKMLQMQVGAVEQQTLADAKRQMEKKQQKIQVGQNGVLRVSAVKQETVPGGTILSYDYETDCSEGEKRSHPTAQLVGVAHNATTRIKIEVNGFIDAATAKAAATEVIAKLAKAN